MRRTKMGHRVVEEARESEQSFDQNDEDSSPSSSSSAMDQDDEEEQLCTRLEQRTSNRTEFLSVSSPDKELILEPSTLIKASGLVDTTREHEDKFRVDEERAERGSIGGGAEVRVEAETDDELVEIELRSEHEEPEEEEDGWSSDNRRTRTASIHTELRTSVGGGGGVMYVEGPNFRLSGSQEQAACEEQAAFRQQQQQQHHRNQFSEAPTKIGFASRRMKDYFESFRGSHRGEKRRLYRFFKSTRTELVACLLFSLISSQALIVSRSGSLQVSSASVSNLSQDLMLQQQTTNTVPQQLAHALGLAFTVASLTQVFGHVSGCHLLPSISVALYVKGHISKGRLASYLVAQMAGSGLGVTLLSLLQSSQISLDEYWHTLRSSQLKYSPASRPEAPPVSGGGGGGGEELATAAGHRRKRRDTGPEVPAADGSGGGGGGSETILLSIMEQQQESKLKLRRAHPPAPSSLLPVPPETGISNKSTYRGGPLEERSESSSITGELSTPSSAAAAAAVAPPMLLRPSFIEQLATLAGPSSPPYTIHSTAAPAIVDSTNRPFETSEPPNDRSRVPAPFEEPSSAASSSPAPPTEPGSSPRPLLQPLAQPQRPTNATRRRNKRNRQTTQTTTSVPADELSSLNSWAHKLEEASSVPQSSSSSASSSASWLRGGEQPEEQLASRSSSSSQPAAGHYINLLELSLPSAIMSSDSIRTCINKQISGSQLPALASSSTGASSMMKNESRLATLAFRHCLALSNSSQMFVFQLLATLLLVLAYLVNVDPRRVDLGFKSLSIGLAYFVACLLTIQSGGFYGNPFQLLFLSWLSSGTEWQPEWFVYLLTPMVGGLFGAVSHEYIDFTSPRNRNKQLHLRRSFYSLDNLPGADLPQLQQLPVPLDQASSSSSSSTAAAQCQLQLQLQAACIQQEQSTQHRYQQQQQHQMTTEASRESPLATTVLEVSSGSRQLVAAARRARKASSSASSLDSSGQPGSSSSVVSLARGSTLALANLQHQMLDQQQQQPLRNSTTTTTTTSAGNNRKLHNSPNSYSRRLKVEQQQLQLADRKRQVMQQPQTNHATGDFLNGKQTNNSQRTSLRRSDFDSNFLISSSSASGSSPTANPRQHQLVNSSVGWM